MNIFIPVSILPPVASEWPWTIELSPELQCIKKSCQNNRGQFILINDIIRIILRIFHCLVNFIIVIVYHYPNRKAIWLGIVQVCRYFPLPSAQGIYQNKSETLHCIALPSG